MRLETSWRSSSGDSSSSRTVFGTAEIEETRSRATSSSALAGSHRYRSTSLAPLNAANCIPVCPAMWKIGNVVMPTG